MHGVSEAALSLKAQDCPLCLLPHTVNASGVLADLPCSEDAWTKAAKEAARKHAPSQCYSNFSKGLITLWFMAQAKHCGSTDITGGIPQFDAAEENQQFESKPRGRGPNLA